MDRKSRRTVALWQTLLFLPKDIVPIILSYDWCIDCYLKKRLPFELQGLVFVNRCLYGIVQDGAAIAPILPARKIAPMILLPARKIAPTIRIEQPYVIEHSGWMTNYKSRIKGANLSVFPLPSSFRLPQYDWERQQCKAEGGNVYTSSTTQIPTFSIPNQYGTYNVLRSVGTWYVRTFDQLYIVNHKFPQGRRVQLPAPRHCLLSRHWCCYHGWILVLSPFQKNNTISEWIAEISVYDTDQEEATLIQKFQLPQISMSPDGYATYLLASDNEIYVGVCRNVYVVTLLHSPVNNAAQIRTRKFHNL